MNRNEIAPVQPGALVFTERHQQSMNNSIVPYSGESRQPQSFQFGENDVRTLIDENGEPLFVASDVCKALGINKPDSAYARLDDDEKDTREISTPGGRQQMIVVNEAGLYSLILRSNKAQAKVFKRWITHEVLPAIRKTGSFLSRPLTTGEMLVANAEAYLRIEKQVTELREQQAQTIIAIEDITAELLDRDYYTVLQYCQKQRIAHTPALRQMWGKAAKAESRARGIEIKDENEGQYNVGRYHKSVLLDVCVPKPRTNGQMTLINGR